jgi:very-short-patch-repair endonuclease
VNEFLKKSGWDVVRFWTHEFEHMEKIIDKIQGFLN